VLRRITKIVRIILLSPSSNKAHLHNGYYILVLFKDWLKLVNMLQNDIFWCITIRRADKAFRTHPSLIRTILGRRIYKTWYNFSTSSPHYIHVGMDALKSLCAKRLIFRIIDDKIPI